MARGRLNRQLFCFALGMLLPLGHALGHADGDPKAKAKPVLEEQLTESKDGLLLLDGKPFSGEVAKYHPNKKKGARRQHLGSSKQSHERRIGAGLAGACGEYVVPTRLGVRPLSLSGHPYVSNIDRP